VNADVTVSSLPGTRPPRAEPALRPSSALVVLHVANHSGPQRSLSERLRPLAEEGTRITTVVPAPGPAASAAAELGEVVTGVPGALIVPRDLSAAARVPSQLRRQAQAVRRAAADAGADLVIVASAVLPGALIGARRSGAATLLYSGDPLAGEGARGAGKRAMARFAGRNADLVLASSRFVADSYRRSGVDATVLYPAIEAPADPWAAIDAGADLRRRLGIESGERLVCSLGAITEGRGQDTLVEALAASRSAGGGWRLVIGGEPYERPLDVAFARRLGELVDRLGVADRVVLAGRVDDPAALYAAADVFVNPARVAEGFGRAGCEALAAGTPVVSTRVGGTGEALRDGETALLVPPGSPAALAAAIDRLLDDATLAGSLAVAGAEDVARRFAPSVAQPVFERAVDAALRWSSRSGSRVGAARRARPGRPAAPLAPGSRHDEASPSRPPATRG